MYASRTAPFTPRTWFIHTKDVVPSHQGCGCFTPRMRFLHTKDAVASRQGCSSFTPRTSFLYTKDVIPSHKGRGLNQKFLSLSIFLTTDPPNLNMSFAQAFGDTHISITLWCERFNDPIPIQPGLASSHSCTTGFLRLLLGFGQPYSSW